MSNFTDAADYIKRQAKLHEGFVNAAAMLERIGSVDQAAKEAEKAREVAEKARDAAVAELDAVKIEIADAKKLGAEILLNARKAAQEKADLIEAKAQTRAEVIVRTAAEAAAAQEAQTKADAKAADAYKVKLLAKNAALETAAQDKQAAIDALQVEHDTLVDAIASLKSKFA